MLKLPGEELEQKLPRGFHLPRPASQNVGGQGRLCNNPLRSKTNQSCLPIFDASLGGVTSTLPEKGADK